MTLNKTAVVKITTIVCFSAVAIAAILTNWFGFALTTLIMAFVVAID